MKKNSELKFWEYLTKKLDGLQDNNKTARLIFDKVSKIIKEEIRFDRGEVGEQKAQKVESN